MKRVCKIIRLYDITAGKNRLFARISIQLRNVVISILNKYAFT